MRISNVAIHEAVWHTMCVQFEDFCNISQAHGAVSVEKLWTQNTRIIYDVWRLLILSNEEKTNAYENVEKRMIRKVWRYQRVMQILKKGG